MAKLSKAEKDDKQANVSDEWFRSCNAKQIVKKLGYPEGEVRHYLKLVKNKLTPKTIKVIEYRRNKLLNKIALVQQKGWDIALSDKTFDDRIRLAALRLVTSSQELEAKVEGVTQEKIVVDTMDRQATEHLKALEKFEKDARLRDYKGDGHDKEAAEAEVASDVPAFLEERNAEQGSH